MKNRSVSITGATGFLGWRLAEAFRDAGWKVRAIVRPGNVKPVPAEVEPFEAPLDAGGSPVLARAFEFSSVVVHAAGLIRARQASAYDRVNVGGTRAVVGAANDSGAHLILMSSQAAIGSGTPARPSREDDEPRPVNAYGRSKLEGEAVVRSLARVPWTILRPSAVYGPRDDGFLPLFRLASRGISLLVAKPSMSFTLIHVDDVVRATLLAATDERAEGQTFFLGHPDPATPEHMLQVLAGVFERPYRPWRLPGAALSTAARLGEISWMLGRRPIVDVQRLAELRAEGFVCSVDRIRAVLGFTAEIGLPQGAAQTAQWYRSQGWV